MDLANLTFNLIQSRSNYHGTFNKQNSSKQSSI
nr:MAG TPA: hypothetical protein [Caudoviricetes sp.]